MPHYLNYLREYSYCMPSIFIDIEEIVSFGQTNSEQWKEKSLVVCLKKQKQIETVPLIQTHINLKCYSFVPFDMSYIF